MRKNKAASEKLKSAGTALTLSERKAVERFASERDWSPSKAIRFLATEALKSRGYLTTEEPATGGTVAA